MKPRALVTALALANMHTLATQAAANPEIRQPPRTTTRNPQQQREAYEAAEAKRLRKQMKRLANMQQSGKEQL